MIWAQDRHGTIGDGVRLLWRVPADFRYFKETTIGHPIIMGRASWEAIGGTALPGRRNIVMTRRRGYEAEGAAVVGSLEEALEMAARSPGGELVWITGGGSVYAEALGRASVLHVSEIDVDVTTGHEDGRVTAPRIDAAEWERDESRSDSGWRPLSGDARWRVDVWRRRGAV
ncbi:MAG TPA: dihydrofolate reductase [Actinomycetaceae bacterium]|nr:dihydrofolate reductase [Actinomycetaceae bacterium]